MLKTIPPKANFTRLVPLKVSSFTLVELLVVVAILGLLAGLLIPVTQKAIAAGKTGKATGNLRQVGVLMNSYLSENNNRITVSIVTNWPTFELTNIPFCQNLLRIHGGFPSKGNPETDPWLPEIFYDPATKGRKHLWGCFGVNDAIMLNDRDCQRVFGTKNGVPISAISPLGGKILMASAIDPGLGETYKSSWMIDGRDWIRQGTNSSRPKPDARHGGKALCLFADGHVEALDVKKMSAADRVKYFQQDPSW